MLNSTINPHARHGFVEFPGYFFVIGGVGPPINVPSVECCQINSDGTLGQWEYSNELNQIRHSFGTAVVNNAVYVMAGSNSETGGSLSSVEEAYILKTIPSFPIFPSLKLFSGQSINHAFNIEDFNTGDISTSYSILSNFLSLSSLDSSSVNQSAYGSPTTGINIYLADNAYGEGTATNEVKYSTYKIYKLPKVGLTVGSSWDVNVANYTYDSNGLAIPPSYGNPDAITVGDTTLVSATWLGNTVIHITSLQPFSGAVNVNVIASPDSSAQSFNSKHVLECSSRGFIIHNSKLIDITASPTSTSPFGIDIDMERIQVYTNLINPQHFQHRQ